MADNKQDSIDYNFHEEPFLGRRRDLLPWWIKVFIWIFLLFGVLAPIGIVMGLLDFRFELNLYGLETTDPITGIGLLISSLFLFKGIVALGLWLEKDWAIKLGQIDAVIGTLICVFLMLILPLLNDNYQFLSPFRLELALLIPFFLKLRKIEKDWMRLSKPNDVYQA